MELLHNGLPMLLPEIGKLCCGRVTRQQLVLRCWCDGIEAPNEHVLGVTCPQHFVASTACKLNGYGTANCQHVSDRRALERRNLDHGTSGDGGKPVVIVLGPQELLLCQQQAVRGRAGMSLSRCAGKSCIKGTRAW
jgi:hypothetical protein